MDFVSGEIYFRSQLSTHFQSEFDEKLCVLDDFLEADANSDLQISQSRAVLNRLRNIRHLNSTVNELTITHDSLTLQQYFEAAGKYALDQIRQSNMRTTAEIAQLQESVDAQVMRHVLEYFSILKKDMNLSRERLDEHSIECNRKKHQAKRLRDIQIFAKHLQIETQGAVSFDLIPTGNPQWTRCGKAVKDNLNKSRLNRYVPYCSRSDSVVSNHLTRCRELIILD